MEPRFDSRPRWWIFKELAKRLDLDESFPYETIGDYLEWVLSDTDYQASDFAETAEIEITSKAIWFDRATDLPFKTASGKIELISSVLEGNGIPSWIPYQALAPLGRDEFCLSTGKTVLLYEQRSSNTIVIHAERATELGLKSGSRVPLGVDGYETTGILEITDWIHPEVAHTLHGFGDSVPKRTRSFNGGFSDVRLARGKLKTTVGGNCPVTETVISVRPA